MAQNDKSLLISYLHIRDEYLVKKIDRHLVRDERWALNNASEWCTKLRLKGVKYSFSEYLAILPENRKVIFFPFIHKETKVKYIGLQNFHKILSKDSRFSWIMMPLGKNKEWSKTISPPNLLKDFTYLGADHYVTEHLQIMQMPAKEEKED